METRIKGKAIIGIAMAAIIVVALMAMAPTASAFTTNRTVYDGEVIIIGETNVSFWNETYSTTGHVVTSGLIKGPTEEVGTVGKNSTQITFTTYLDTEDQGLVNAEYYVIDRDTSTVQTRVYFNNPSFTLKTLKAAGGDEVSSCTKGESIFILVKTNLNHINTTETGWYNYVDLKIADPKGVGRDVKNVQLNNATGNNETEFTNTDEVGEYTVYVKTNKSVSNGLDTTSAEIKFTVTDAGISISADKDRIAKNTEVVLTGTTSPKTAVWVNVTSGVKGNVNFTAKGSYTGVEHTATTALPGVEVTTTSGGAYTVVAKIKATGAYEFTARLGATTTTKKVTVEVTDLVATVTTDKTTYKIGESIKISGTSNAGDYAIVAFDGRAIANETIKADDTFSCTLSGSTVRGAKPPGSYKIEVFINPITTGTDPTLGITGGDKTTAIYKPGTTTAATADDSTVVLLTEPGLTASLTTKTAALGDDFKVEGTAEGSSIITVLVVAPKGAAGTGILDDVQADTGISLKEASVSTIDYTFSLKRDVDKSGIDTGKYLVVVISPGRDGNYGRTENVTLLGAVEYDSQYDLTGKTQSQIIAILNDVCSATLSDDLMWMDYITLETAFVALDPIQAVAAGDPLAVSGTSNRKDGYNIMVTVEGPTSLVPANVKVENGVFNATFDTTDAPVGEYTVEADDGDGHTDTATVEILTEVPVATPTPTPKPTAKPTAAPAPTAKPTAAPTATPTATPEPPGFEAVFAIAGLLSIAYLVLRKRRE